MKYLNIIVLVITFCAAPLVFAGGDAAAGKEKSQACASCHGADGNSPSPAFPKLAGQYEDYLLNSLREYKKGDRKNPVMAGMVAGLNDDDLKNLAAFYAAQKGLFNTSVGAFSPDK